MVRIISKCQFVFFSFDWIARNCEMIAIFFTSWTIHIKKGNQLIFSRVTCYIYFSNLMSLCVFTCSMIFGTFSLIRCVWFFVIDQNNSLHCFKCSIFNHRLVVKWTMGRPTNKIKPANASHWSVKCALGTIIFQPYREALISIISQMSITATNIAVLASLLLLYKVRE